MLRDDVEKSVKSVQCTYACGGTSLVNPCLQQHWHDICSLLVLTDIWNGDKRTWWCRKLESFLSSSLWCVQLQLEYFQCVGLVINAKERRKFIIIPRGFLSKLNRSINIRVELIDRLKKKLLEEYFCDGDSKVCEINMIYIGPSMWRMLLAKFLANVLLVLTI